MSMAYRKKWSRSVSTAPLRSTPSFGYRLIGERRPVKGKPQIAERGRYRFHRNQGRRPIGRQLRLKGEPKRYTVTVDSGWMHPPTLDFPDEAPSFRRSCRPFCCVTRSQRQQDDRKGNEMKRIPALLLLAASGLAGCSPTQQGAGIGAATGAVVGGIATGNVRGAAVGAAVGGVAGAVIGNVAGQPGKCYYRDRNGQQYVAACPQ